VSLKTNLQNRWYIAMYLHQSHLSLNDVYNNSDNDIVNDIFNVVVDFILQAKENVIKI
jgi:hypothetical protein